MQIKNYVHTFSPNESYTFVRASISNKCHMNCVYCPKEYGMENIVPPSIRGKILSFNDYTKNLLHIFRNGIEGISFTGGETTLNEDLPRYLEFASKTFKRVELNTNAYNLTPYLEAVSKHVNLLKISLDTTIAEDLHRITSGRSDDFYKIIEAITLACRKGINIAINAVIFKSNLDQVKPLIELCRNFKKINDNNIYVSFLDLYYTDEKKEFFLNEFIPLNTIANEMKKNYGEPYIQDRHGCIFYWFDANGIIVRFKDSNSLTYRSTICDNCSSYCQEGLYSLKHSIEGWVTTCPSQSVSKGGYLCSRISNRDADRILKDLILKLKTATPDLESYKKFCFKNHIL